MSFAVGVDDTTETESCTLEAGLSGGGIPFAAADPVMSIIFSLLLELSSSLSILLSIGLLLYLMETFLLFLLSTVEVVSRNFSFFSETEFEPEMSSEDDTSGDSENGLLD